MSINKLIVLVVLSISPVVLRQSLMSHKLSLSALEPMTLLPPPPVVGS